MQRIKRHFAELSPKDRRILWTLAFVTGCFVLFSLASTFELLPLAFFDNKPQKFASILISLVGCISVTIAWTGKARLASYLFIVVTYVSFVLSSTLSTQPTFSTINGLMCIVIPVAIAAQALAEKEFVWVVVLTILTRSILQILETFKPNSLIAEADVWVGQFVGWVTVLTVLFFVGYVAYYFNKFPFRVKMILVLGIMTMLPTTILEKIASHNLETSLVDNANQSLVLSSEHLASDLDIYIQTTQDITYTEAQIPSLADFIGQYHHDKAIGGQLMPKDINLERNARETLLSFLKRDSVNILSCKLIDSTGTVQLSTQGNEIGRSELAQEYFYYPLSNGLSYISPVYVSDAGQGSIHFSAPVRAAGTTIGVLDITYSASIFQQIIVRNNDKLNLSTSSMLLDENSIILANTSSPEFVYKIVNPSNIDTLSKLVEDGLLQNLKPEQLAVYMPGLTEGIGNISNVQYFSGDLDHETSQSLAENPTPDRAGLARLQIKNWYVVTFIPQNTLLAPVQSQARSVVLVSILINLIGIVIALGVTQAFISPIISLTRASKQITQGNIDTNAAVTTEDEFGMLALAFNSMTARIRSLINSLEQRVAERTRSLEKRAMQLQAAADVGSTVAQLRNLNELMQQVTSLISQRFGFYHVGIFLLDDRGEYAVLRAANSTGGERMLARGHKLKVGEVGIVGYVTSTGQARIALDVGQDSRYFNNPDLPTTRSEMAFPLIAGNKILGALDIQSEQEAAFSDEDIMTLKVLADQIGVAIENAHLFSENQAALEAARRAYRQVSQNGWKQTFEETEGDLGYISSSDGQIARVAKKASPELMQALQEEKPVFSKNGRTLHLPVKVRGQNIGVIQLSKHRGRARWEPEEIQMATEFTDQLGTALESARLYTDVRQRGDRERLVTEIIAKIQTTTDPQEMAELALAQLKQALGTENIRIRPYSPPTHRSIAQKSHSRKSK